MNFELILIRYGEIALKGKFTRKYFENILLRNIKTALDYNNISHKIESEWGRIYVFTEKINDTIEILRKIFEIIFL